MLLLKRMVDATTWCVAHARQNFVGHVLDPGNLMAQAGITVIGSMKQILSLHVMLKLLVPFPLFFCILIIVHCYRSQDQL